MGDKSEFAAFKSLIEDQTELGDKRPELLRGKSQNTPVNGALVCSCGQIGRGNIEEAVKEGCVEFKSLCQKTGAGMGCGSCKPEVKRILDNQLQVLPS